MYISWYIFLAIYYICNSCNIGTSDLPDMYALSRRACGPQAWAYISGKSLVPMLQLLHVVC